MVTFALSSNNYFLTIQNLTNPNDLSDVYLNVVISSSLYIAYNNSLLINPGLVPINFNSLISSSNNVANSLNNITISNLPSSGSSLNLSIPINSLSSINNVYYNNVLISNWSDTINSTYHFVQIQGLNLVSGGLLTINVINYIAVQNINNKVIITSRLPYSIGSAYISLNIIPFTLSTNIIITSYKVNQISNYTLNVTLLQTKTDTYSDIILPFTFKQVNISNSQYVIINSTTLRITSFTLNILSLVFYNVTNPPNDKSMNYQINQYSNITNTLIAQGSSNYSMI